MPLNKLHSQLCVCSKAALLHSSFISVSQVIRVCLSHLECKTWAIKVTKKLSRFFTHQKPFGFYPENEEFNSGLLESMPGPCSDTAVCIATWFVVKVQLLS